MAGKMKTIIKKLRPGYVGRGIRYLKKNGGKAFFVRVFTNDTAVIPYEKWFRLHRVRKKELEQQRRERSDGLKFSILVPVYQTPEKFLREMLHSVQEQSYRNWELCIANGSPENAGVREILEEYQKKDGRIRVRNLEENRGIAGNTNAALEMASGDFAALLDHDDLLEPDALYEMAALLKKNPDMDAVYTDEDKVNGQGTSFFQPHFKPDFNPDLLRSNNYICHFFAVRTDLARRTGGFRREYEGAQDYDYIFRCTEQSSRIGHVPRILYHWRTHSQSTAENPESKQYAFEAGARAIESHLKRQGVKASVNMRENPGFYRVSYDVQGSPLVSVLIPNKDQKEKLQVCVESILAKTAYENYEILIIENNSVTPEIFAYYKELEKNPRIQILRWERAFNYSAINNYGAEKARGEYLLLLNNDVEILQEGWMKELVGNCQREEVGAVGVKLYYPDGTIQHAGTIVGLGGVEGHAFAGFSEEQGSYMHRAAIQMDYSAVTAACMMVRKEVFFQAGGLEEKLEVAFNDVDFCLKLRKLGYLIVYDPDVKLYHYESATRGEEDNPEKKARFQREIDYMKQQWQEILEIGDPCYNPNLTLLAGDYSQRWGG